MPHPSNRTTTASGAPMNRGDAEGRHFGIRLSRWLVNGVPYLGTLTAFAAGLVFLAFAFSGPRIAETASQTLATADWTHLYTLAALLYKIGLTAFWLLPAAIAAYVAYGMADRPAVIPGLLGGVAAMGVQAGSLGGLIAGLIAGTVTLALSRITVPPALRGITSTVLAPLLTTVVTAVTVTALVGAQLNALSQWLYTKQAMLEFHNALALGLLLGLVVCADLGGLITKTAISFGSVMLAGDDPSLYSTRNMTIMAAVVAAAMVPPLGMTLATLVRRALFTEAERNYGKVAWLFGAACIPEGTVPFALADPLRVIPASMAGGAVTGGLVMTLGVTAQGPYGGVFAAGQFGKPLLFAVAILAGALVTAGVTVALKSLGRRKAPLATGAAARIRTKVAVAD
ncbi:fructose-specific PTS transporter subunit EIIC [Streptomyces fuscichromogenes]|uniref:fructose-specific PTS transporter subunit EIIC n=1 Tax=Streptomyces fuscichromogenes TaxID=1324013 RepID=UPI00382EF65D